MPSPIGALLILSPLTLELSEIGSTINFPYFVPAFTLLIAILLISKVPTYSFKKIKIRPGLTIFILFVIGVSFVTLMFFTFETLIVFSFLYLLSIPLACFTYYKNKKLNKSEIIEEEHEDIL